jgi:DNA-binding NarL/FixJ family response regulator
VNTGGAAVRSPHGAERITLVVADDHALFREGVTEMLSTSPRLHVVGEAAEGQSAIDLCVRHRPDVLLLDVQMPGPRTPALIRRIRQSCPDTRIIVLTMHDNAEIVHDLVGCGASAYLVKNILRDELIAAFCTVAREPATVVLSISRHTMEQFDARRQDTGNPLTDRELNVLRLAAQALSNAQIASRLRIAESTVKRHLTNVYVKLDAVSRVDAIRKATAGGLIGPDAAQPPE